MTRSTLSTLSTVGFGTSRRDGADSPAAIARAIAHGVTVFDVVPYCRDGAAERAVATALAEVAQGDANVRERLVVMTRGGVLPEPVLDFGRHRAMVEQRYIAPRLFAWEELALGCHSIAPRFLRHGLEASLARLAMPSVDVFWISSPSTQLAIADRRTIDARLRAAFAELEACVAEGKARCYGIANVGELALENVVALAEEVAGPRHHLRAIQTPLSLHEADVQLRPTQTVAGRAMSVVEAARELGLYVFACGAVADGSVRYEVSVEDRAALGYPSTDAQLAIQWARSVPGVDTVLVGMRQLAHVDENCRVLSIPRARAEDALALFGLGEDEPS